MHLLKLGRFKNLSRGRFFRKRKYSIFRDTTERDKKQTEKDKKPKKEKIYDREQEARLRDVQEEMFDKYARYFYKAGSVPFKIKRTKEEYEESRLKTLKYNYEMAQFDKKMHDQEERIILLRNLALEDTPMELKQEAIKEEDVAFPDDFIFARADPPLEGVDVFGEFQKPGNGNKFHSYFKLAEMQRRRELSTKDNRPPPVEEIVEDELDEETRKEIMEDELMMLERQRLERLKKSTTKKVEPKKEEPVKKEDPKSKKDDPKSKKDDKSKKEEPKKDDKSKKDEPKSKKEEKKDEKKERIK